MKSLIQMSIDKNSNGAIDRKANYIVIFLFSLHTSLTLKPLFPWNKKRSIIIISPFVFSLFLPSTRRRSALKPNKKNFFLCNHRKKEETSKKRDRKFLSLVAN